MFRRAVVAFLALCLGATLILVGTVARPVQTDASWSDAEVTRGPVTAKVIPPAVVSSCRFQPTSVVPVVLVPYFEIKWSFATGSGYTPASNLIVAKSITSGLGGALEPLVGGGLTTTGPDGSGVYTTQVQTGLLGNLLGGTFNLAVIAKEGDGTTRAIWQAVPARVNATVNLAGLSGSCTVS